MLRYLATGIRQYARRPSPILARRCWELQAVVAGRIAPLLAGGKPESLAAEQLWISQPGHVHGWTGDGGPATVAVIHTVTIPQALKRLFPARVDEPLMLGWRMPRADLDWFATAVGSLKAALPTPDELTPLLHDQTLIELSIRALRCCPFPRRQRHNLRAEELVEAAVAWYLEHLREGPREIDLTDRVGVSPATLRRAFRATTGESPRRHLERMRLRHADDLLGGSTASIAEVARACGFADQASFSHAYKRFVGRSPRQFRIDLPNASELPSMACDQPGDSDPGRPRPGPLP